MERERERGCRQTESMSDSHALFLSLRLSALFPFFFPPVNPLVFLLFSLSFHLLSSVCPFSVSASPRRQTRGRITLANLQLLISWKVPHAAVSTE